MRYPTTIKIGDRKSVSIFKTNLTNKIKENKETNFRKNESFDSPIFLKI